jgi:hypothetical protein
MLHLKLSHLCHSLTAALLNTASNSKLNPNPVLESYSEASDLHCVPQSVPQISVTPAFPELNLRNVSEPLMEEDKFQTLVRSPAVKQRSFKHSLEASEQIFDTLMGDMSKAQATLATGNQFIFVGEPVSDSYFLNLLLQF